MKVLLCIAVVDESATGGISFSLFSIQNSVEYDRRTSVW